MNSKVVLRALPKHQACFFSSAFQIGTIPGSPKYQDNTKKVELRGIHLTGRFPDLPNLIFFPEACDLVENWIPFFTDPDNSILDYRNVYLVYPRNFGTSDRNESFDVEEMSNDIARFMYQHKISTATLAGHGLGARVALAFSCYHFKRVTGFVGLDYAPLDYRAAEPFEELAQYVKLAGDINIKRRRSQIERDLFDNIKCPKWRTIFGQNLRRISPGNFEWNFDRDIVNKNFQKKDASCLADWTSRHGLFTGRTSFIFPETSRWVRLSTNTLAIMKICIKNRGYGRDIFGYQEEDVNPLNHWIYDSVTGTDTVGKLVTRFIRKFDGVHPLLYDRDEIGKHFLPSIPGHRVPTTDSPTDYTPAHLYHNWRFVDVYDQSKK